jgi:hypothetical protein
MKRIGLLEDRNVAPMPSLAYRPFVHHGMAREPRNCRNDIAFAGNVYLSDPFLQLAALARHPMLKACYQAVAEKTQPLAVPAWTRMAEFVDRLPAAERRASRLDYDQSFFWSFANNLIGHFCNTRARLEVLTAIDRPLAFYGSFADPKGVPRLQSLVDRLEHKGSVDFATQLPQVYADTRILIDLTNAAFIRNCSTKPICCFAAGGFALFDYKPDAAAALGPDAERVMYRDLDDLRDKVEYFLAHEEEREELADHLRDVIHRKFRFGQAVHDAAAVLVDTVG